MTTKKKNTSLVKDGKAAQKNAHGLSISTENKGFTLQNDSFEVVRDVFGLLFERLDEEMMR